MNEERKRKTSQQDDSEDESERILEESPCGRWQKRGEEVEQRNIPGIDACFLAMDTEEGVEVVWNEVVIRNWDHKQSKVKEEKIKVALEQLIQLDHPNIVKMHKYWTDVKEDAVRVIFITEYMSSGSLKQFLRKTKRNVIKMALPAWKRWCTQLLSALCYMHSSSPPVIHGNLSCDTICISHTGLIKIDAVAPNAIQRSLRSLRHEPPRNLHFVAPEIGHYKEDGNVFQAPFPPPLSAAMDIYSFGICALEMAALEISATPDSHHVTPELVVKTIDSLDNSLQKDFIRACLNQYPSKRPTAKKLLFHKVLFEVPSLRLLSAHVVVNTPSFQPEQLTDETLLRHRDPTEVVAEIRTCSGVVISTLQYSDLKRKEVEKFLEEVRNGAYPLTALVPTYRPPVISRHRDSPEIPDSPETFDEETRRIISVGCEIKNNSVCMGQLSLNLRMEDQMNRHVCCDLQPDVDPSTFIEELLHFGLIPVDGRESVKNAIEAKLKSQSSAPNSSVKTT